MMTRQAIRRSHLKMARATKSCAIKKNQQVLLPGAQKTGVRKAKEIKEPPLPGQKDSREQRRGQQRNTSRPEVSPPEEKRKRRERTSLRMKRKTPKGIWSQALPRRGLWIPWPAPLAVSQRKRRPDGD